MNLVVDGVPEKDAEQDIEQVAELSGGARTFQQPGYRQVFCNCHKVKAQILTPRERIKSCPSSAE